MSSFILPEVIFVCDVLPTRRVAANMRFHSKMRFVVVLQLTSERECSATGAARMLFSHMVVKVFFVAEWITENL